MTVGNKYKNWPPTINPKPVHAVPKYPVSHSMHPAHKSRCLTFLLITAPGVVNDNTFEGQ